MSSSTSLLQRLREKEKEDAMARATPPADPLLGDGLNVHAPAWGGNDPSPPPAGSASGSGSAPPQPTASPAASAVPMLPVRGPNANASSFQPHATASDGRALCKFFSFGGCNKGADCPFSHDLTVEAPHGVDSSSGFVLSGNVANAQNASPQQITPPTPYRGGQEFQFGVPSQGGGGMGHHHHHHAMRHAEEEWRQMQWVQHQHQQQHGQWDHGGMGDGFGGGGNFSGPDLGMPRVPQFPMQYQPAALGGGGGSGGFDMHGGHDMMSGGGDAFYNMGGVGQGGPNVGQQDFGQQSAQQYHDQTYFSGPASSVMVGGHDGMQGQQQQQSVQGGFMQGGGNPGNPGADPFFLQRQQQQPKPPNKDVLSSADMFPPLPGQQHQQGHHQHHQQQQQHHQQQQQHSHQHHMMQHQSSHGLGGGSNGSDPSGAAGLAMETASNASTTASTGPRMIASVDSAPYPPQQATPAAPTYAMKLQQGQQESGFPSPGGRWPASIDDPQGDPKLAMAQALAQRQQASGNPQDATMKKLQGPSAIGDLHRFLRNNDISTSSPVPQADTNGTVQGGPPAGLY